VIELSNTPAGDTQSVVVLGATGTIGDNTLDVIRRHRDRYRVVALSANENVTAMAKLVDEFSPESVVMGSDVALAELRKLVSDPKIEFLSGEQGLCEISAHPDVDTVVAGIVGAAGLTPVLAAARAGKRILLANKEPMVMLGGTIMQAAEESGAVMLPLSVSAPASWPGWRGRDANPRGRQTGCADGLGWAIQNVFIVSASRGNSRAGVPTSQLGDGPKNFCRFRHADEQGA